MSVWNLMFLVGIIVGYRVLRSTFPRSALRQPPTYLLARYLLCVYICALGAQWFAYLVDANTTLLPPDQMGYLRYYFHPLSGPKTLYGAVLILPLGSLVAFRSSPGLSRAGALDHATPALFAILGFARIGCFLQGCCYGLRSTTWGLSFPVGSAVHGDQVTAGLVGLHSAALPVLPLQIVSAAACFSLAVFSWRALRAGRCDVFSSTVVGYSVFRFAIEFLRADPARNYAGLLSTSQWVALLVLALIATKRLRPSVV